MTTPIDPSILADLAEFDDGFEMPSARGLQLEDVPDGQHVLEILGCNLEKTERAGKNIARWYLLAHDGAMKGSVVEMVHPLTDREQVGRLCKDLAAIGVAVAPVWAAGTDPKHKFSVEFPKMLPGFAGTIFVGKKRTWDAPGSATQAARKMHFLEWLRVVTPGTGRPSQAPPQRTAAKSAPTGNQPF